LVVECTWQVLAVWLVGPVVTIWWLAAWHRGRWRWMLIGCLWTLWWPAALRSGPELRGPLASETGSGWMRQSLHRDNCPGPLSLLQMRSSSAYGHYGWRQTKQPPVPSPAEPSELLRSGNALPSVSWRYLERGRENIILVCVCVLKTIPR
jgi:hypothetical protein